MNIYNAVGSYVDDKQELSLVEKKKLQWSQEKADQNEWFPFGKKTDYHSRKSSEIVNNNNESTQALEKDNLTTTTAITKTAIITTKGQIISPNLLQNQDFNGIGGGGAPLSQTASHYAHASQPTDKVIHVHIGPPAPNAFVPSQPSSSSITTTVPVLNFNKGYTSGAAALMPSPLLVGEQFSSVIAAMNLTHQQPILIHQMPVARQNMGQSPTNGSYSPANFYGFKAGGYVDSNDSLVRIQQNPHEFTEQWANQLNYWQKLQSPDDNAANFIIDNINQKILSRREENRLIAAAASQHPSTFVCSTPVPQQNFHQPNVAYALNPPLPMAYVSPLIFNSETQRTAPMASPLASKPSSINGQDFVEPVYQSFNCFSPRKISALDDSLNYSNNAIKINGEELTTEQKQKIMENKAAIGKQIIEKQRLKALEAERERMENERLEKERHLIELKEKLENQKELTRWKELQREEELREAAVKEALEKARLEAQMHHPSKQPAKQLQDVKFVSEKVEKIEKTVKAESRLPSAATYIISREAIFDPKEQSNEKTTESTKTFSPRKNVSIAEPLTASKLVKSKSECAFKTLLTKKSNVDIPADKQCTPKTGCSNGSRNIVAPDLVNRDDVSNSNPWGDQFGGLNPLLHRLSTRKKVRQVQLQQHLDASFNSSLSSQPTKVLSKTPPSGTSSPQKEPVVKTANNANTTPKLPNRTPEKSSQSSKEERKSDQSLSNISNNNNVGNPLLQKISTRKKLAANSTQDVKFFSEESRNNKDTIVLAKNVVKESVKDDSSLRLSKNDVSDVHGSEFFSKKNTACRSFAVRSKQASEKQSDMLKQLSSLKEQLKISQRVVENSMRTKALLSKPEAVVVPNTRICKHV